MGNDAQYFATTSVAPTFTFTNTTVKDAKKALKRAKAAEKAARQERKWQERQDAQRAADRELALKALRAVAKDDRKYSADARVIAAEHLLAQG